MQISQYQNDSLHFSGHRKTMSSFMWSTVGVGDACSQRPNSWQLHCTANIWHVSDETHHIVSNREQLWHYLFGWAWFYENIQCVKAFRNTSQCTYQQRNISHHRSKNFSLIVIFGRLARSYWHELVKATLIQEIFCWIWFCAL